MFIIGHLRGERTRKVFPITGTNSKTLKQIVGGSQGMRVYDPNGLACTQAAEAGGLGAKTGLYSVPVLTPDREKKRQNGRRFKEDGEPMFTLTSQDRHGIMVTRNEIKSKTETSHCLMARDYKGIGNQEMTAVMEIKEATKKGYSEAEQGDSINIEQPNSKTRRGRAGKGVANTITTSCNQAVIEGIDVIGNIYKSQGQAGKVYTTNGLSPTVQGQRTNSQGWMVKDFRIRRLTPKECWRLQGFPDWAFDRAKEAGVSDSQLYKQAGNSVTVTVVYEIAKGLK